MPERLYGVPARCDSQIGCIRDTGSDSGSGDSDSDSGSGDRRHAGMIHEITLAKSDAFPNSLFETQSTFMSRPAVA
jgi:hypothetical protein